MHIHEAVRREEGDGKPHLASLAKAFRFLISGARSTRCAPLLCITAANNKQLGDVL